MNRYPNLVLGGNFFHTQFRTGSNRTSSTKNLVALYAAKAKTASVIKLSSIVYAFNVLYGFHPRSLDPQPHPVSFLNASIFPDEVTTKESLVSSSDGMYVS